MIAHFWAGLRSFELVLTSAGKFVEYKFLGETATDM